MADLRELTLNEKVTLKGKLSRYKLTPQRLARLDMRDARFLWSGIMAKPMCDYPKLKG